jgi:hypothetical protein
VRATDERLDGVGDRIEFFPNFLKDVANDRARDRALLQLERLLDLGPLILELREDLGLVLGV